MSFWLKIVNFESIFLDIFIYNLNLMISQRTIKDLSYSQSQFIAKQFQKVSKNINSKHDELNKIQIHDLSKIKNYYEINKPLISQAQRTLIEQKLELEKKVNNSTENRLKNNDYFLRYNYNPFAKAQLGKESQLSKSEDRINGDQNGNNELDNIIEAVSNIKDGKFKFENSQFQQRIIMHRQIAQNLNRSIPALHNKIHIKNQSLTIKQPQRDMTFEQIIQLTDSNFYAQNLKQLNIFSHLFSSQSTGGKQTLFKFHFNFTSAVEKLSRYKFPISRDLSRLARRLVLKEKIPLSTRIDLLNSHQLTFKATDIRFIDLLNISSGRLDPEITYKILFEGNALKDISTGSSIADFSQINYKQNQNQQVMNFSGRSNQKQEVQEYLRLQTLPQQEKYTKKCQQFSNSVKYNILQRTGMVRNTIKDKKSHQFYDKNTQRQINLLFNMDAKRENQSIDRIIRQNKSKKNRNQGIKIRALLDTIVLKNKQQQRINQLINGISKK